MSRVVCPGAGVCVQIRGLCPDKGSVSRGVSPCPGGLCPEGSLSRGRAVPVQGGLCLEDLCLIGVFVQGEGGSLSEVGLCQGGLCYGDPQTETPHIVTSGQYASYWNAFW